MPITQSIKTSELGREIRFRLGLTQKQFAAKVGVTFAAVNPWENGKAQPSPMARKLLEAALAQIGESFTGSTSQAWHNLDLLAKPFNNEG